MHMHMCAHMRARTHTNTQMDIYVNIGARNTPAFSPKPVRGPFNEREDLTEICSKTKSYMGGGW